jgi:hypothetical protein
LVQLKEGRRWWWCLDDRAVATWQLRRKRVQVLIFK